MKTLLVALATVLALSGCGSDSDGSAKESEKSVTPTPSATPTQAPTTEAPAMTLRDICPQVETALPGGMIPEAPALADFATTLRLLRNDGDLESQNALELLIDPVGDLENEVRYGSTGQPLTDAVDGYLDSISSFADRCQAAGSSALQ